MMRSRSQANEMPEESHKPLQAEEPSANRAIVHATTYEQWLKDLLKPVRDASRESGSIEIVS